MRQPIPSQGMRPQDSMRFWSNSVDLCSSGDEIDIPEEHADGLDSGEYMNRYGIKITVLNQAQNSFGLFDFFQLKNKQRETYWITNASYFVRREHKFFIKDASENLLSDLNSKNQLLLTTTVSRNKFTIESPVLNMIRTKTEKMVTYFESDNEDCYNPYGNAKHPLNKTCERMYTVVSKVSNYGHELQQGDIIKLGRTKFLVREINIVSQNL